MAQMNDQTQRTGTQMSTSDAKEQAKQVADEARHQAKDVARQAQDKATTAIQGRKDQAANQLDDIAEAFRETGSQLRDRDKENIARYSDSIADQVERMSGYLSNNDISGVLDDAERLARRQPELFLGGAFTLGLLAARFFKSSSPSGHRDYSRRRRYDEGARRRWEYENSNPGDWERGGWREDRGYRTSRYGTRNVEDYPVPTGATTSSAMTTRPESRTSDFSAGTTGSDFSTTGSTTTSGSTTSGSATVGRNAGMTAGTASTETTSGSQTTSRRTFDKDSDSDKENQ